MYSLVQTELSCPMCCQHREHTVLRSEEDIVRALCNTCGHLRLAAQTSGVERGGRTLERTPRAMPFGHDYLGAGRTRIEGRLSAVSGPLGQRFQAVVEEAKALADAGVHFFRFEARTGADLTLIRKVKETANLPVVAELHDRFAFVREAIGAGANGLGLTLRDANDARSLLAHLYGGPRIPLFVKVSSRGTIAPLQAAGHNLIVLDVKAARAPSSREEYLQWGGKGDSLLRLAYCPANPVERGAPGVARANPVQDSPELVQHALVLTRWLQSGVVDVLAVDVGDAVMSAEIAATVVDVVQGARRQHAAQPNGAKETDGSEMMHFGRRQTLEYLVRKAIFRVATKPLRIVSQWESDPNFVVRSLAVRTFTKPSRMLRELQRAARRID